jgi:hypothetical protein
MVVHADQAGSELSSLGMSSGAKRADLVLDISSRSIQIVSRVVREATPRSPSSSGRYQCA